MPPEHSLNEALESAMLELTTPFSRPIDVEQTLIRVTAAAVHLIDGVDYADVMLRNDGEFRSLAPPHRWFPTSTRCRCTTSRDRPCLEAAQIDSVVRSADLRREQRWPEFVAAAIAAGVYSTLSFQLYNHHRGAGALDLFSKRPNAFELKAGTTLAMLATHAAITLIAADKDTQFRSALASRDLIGQAKGIIMERFNLMPGAPLPCSPNSRRTPTPPAVNRPAASRFAYRLMADFPTEQHVLH